METETSEPIAVSPTRAAQLVGLGRSRIFGLIRDGDLPSFKVGRRRLIAVSELRGFIARKVADGAKERAA